MKFTVSSSAFSSRLTAASKVLLSKNTMPILECFLLDVKNGHVSITASDGEKYFTTSVPLIDCDNNGRLCVPARLLIDSIKELAEQPVTLDFNPENMEIRMTHQTGYFTLMGQDAEVFPTQANTEADATTLKLSSTTLLKGINLCINATASDQLRLIMTCIYLDVHEDYINFAATDGRKLVRYTNKECKAGMTTSMIMPKTVAMVLRNTLTPDTDLVFTFDKQQAQLHTDELDFSFRLVEGNYLNYNAVIPTSNPYCATVDRASLLGAMKRVSVFCNQSNGLTKIHLEGGLVKLTAQDIDYGRIAEENLLCEYTNSPINIGLNCFYVMDMISVLDSEHISVQLADASRPALITPLEQPEGEETTMLIMPMMLNE
ncbi:MAG: DNA polymerase III subunit beta [Prevotellaceae bacterium]|nr:DNA polymerase III subunit beta [Prevotellaceae bacterium]MCD8303615.1 DNA polymerase III subunit beta [Prevotellaceae bacterium]